MVVKSVTYSWHGRWKGLHSGRLAPHLLMLDKSVMMTETKRFLTRTPGRLGCLSLSKKVSQGWDG